MIVLTTFVLGIATADLIRWSPVATSGRRAALAAVGATALVVLLSALSGLSIGPALAIDGGPSSP